MVADKSYPRTACVSTGGYVVLAKRPNIGSVSEFLRRIRVVVGVGVDIARVGVVGVVGVFGVTWPELALSEFSEFSESTLPALALSELVIT